MRLSGLVLQTLAMAEQWESTVIVLGTGPLQGQVGRKQGQKPQATHGGTRKQITDIALCHPNVHAPFHSLPFPG